MTREEAMKRLKEVRFTVQPYQYINEALDTAIKALEQEPCEMTAEDYRQRMMQAFHNADCDELIAVCVLPTEKEFEHLEWLLKNHYKKEPCEDAISRTDVLELIEDINDTVFGQVVSKGVMNLPSVNPQKIGHWIVEAEDRETGYGGCTMCSECSGEGDTEMDYCPHCGAQMVEPQESEVEE